MQQAITFPSGTVNYAFDFHINQLPEIIGGRRAVLVTDTNIAACYPGFFAAYTTLQIPATEHAKTLFLIETLTSDLLHASADRNTVIIGVGGGVVTDIVGFLASTYMRGVTFGFIPTSLLGMVDAA